MSLVKTILLAFCLTGCVKSSGFMKSKGGAIGANADGIRAQVQADKGGVLTAVISANTSLAQTVNASTSDSSISRASVTFPPGSLAISTSVTIEQGAALAAPAFASELGLDSANSVSSAGTAIVISAAQNVNAVTPFTIAVPLGDGAGLADTDPNLLVVIYRCWHADTNTVVMGVIPHSELTIKANTLEFSTKFFGQYQAAYTTQPVTTRVKATSTVQPLTKVAEKALTPITWQSISAGFDPASRMIKASAVVSGFSTVSACGLVLSQNKLPPFGFNASLGAATSGSVAIGSLAAGTYYAQISCNEASGRSSASSWSDAITITITAPVVPVATPAPIATPSTPRPVAAAPQLQSVNPADGASAVALDIPVSALFDSPLVAQSSSALASLFKLSVNNVDDLTLPVPAGSIAFSGTMTQPNANTLAFMPATNYPLLSRMTAQLSSGVVGTNGMSSTTSKQWSFMTRDGAWTTTPDARTALTPATAPTAVVTAVGTNGDILALRIESTALYAHYLPAGGTTWQITTLDSGNSYSGGQVAVDDEGNAYALWLQSNYTAILRVFNKRSASWSAAFTIETNSGMAPSPQIAVFGGNQLRLVSYSNSSGTSGALKTKTYSDVGGMQATTTISGGSSISSPSSLSMSVNNFGDYIIAWIDSSSITASYQLAHGTDNSGTTPVTIATSPDQFSSLQSGIDDAGHAMLMYNAKSSPSLYNKLIANVRQNATWTPQTLTSLAFSGTTISSPVLSVSSGGNARVAWFDNVHGVQTSAATSGTWQATPDVINASTTAFDTSTPSHLLLATNGKGDAALAWGAPSSAAYFGCNLSIGHSTPVYNSVLSGTTLSNLSLTLDQSGNATMLGLFNTNTPYSVYTTRIPRGLTNWSPMSAINSTSDTAFKLSPPSSPTTVINAPATSVDRAGRVYYVSTSSPNSVPTINVNIFK